MQARFSWIRKVSPCEVNVQTREGCHTLCAVMGPLSPALGKRLDALLTLFLPALLALFPVYMFSAMRSTVVCRDLMTLGEWSLHIYVSSWAGVPGC